MKIKFLLAMMLSLVLVIMEGYRLGSGGEEGERERVRPPSVAGTFYPGAPNTLREDIISLLDGVPKIKPAGPILAAVAPHAGYIYSGGVAAYTHQVISNIDFDTLIIIGHDTTYTDIVAFTCPVDYFQTPLGKMPVDREMMEKMLKFNDGIKSYRLLFARDHTIEVQLPFLQVLGRKCKIVPMLFGRPTEQKCRILADAILASSGNKRAFVLASADMSHFPPYDLAREVDRSTLDELRFLDVGRLFSHLKRQEGEASIPNLQTALCAKGGVGTAILFARARGADHVQILRYANSGDVPRGDRRGVVGYASVLMVKKEAPSEPTD